MAAFSSLLPEGSNPGDSSDTGYHQGLAPGVPEVRPGQDESSQGFTGRNSDAIASSVLAKAQQRIPLNLPGMGGAGKGVVPPTWSGYQNAPVGNPGLGEFAQGVLGDAGRFLKEHVLPGADDANSPSTRAFYNQSRQKDWLGWDQLSPGQRQQVFEAMRGYQRSAVQAGHTGFGDLTATAPTTLAAQALKQTPLKGAIEVPGQLAQRAFYSLGEGEQTYGPYEKATEQQRQQAINGPFGGQNLLNFLGAGANDLAPGSLGQAADVGQQGLDAMRAKLPGSAGSTLAGAINDQGGTYSQRLGQPPTPPAQPAESMTPAATPSAAGALGFMGTGDLQSALTAAAPEAKNVLGALGETFGGKVESADQIASRLSQYTVDQAQAIAADKSAQLSQELETLYGSRPEPPANPTPEQQATYDEGLKGFEDQVQQKMLEIGKYERAMRDVTEGRAHPSTPWADSIANHLAEHLGTTELPTAGAPGQEGVMLRHEEGNMLMRKIRGYEDGLPNLLDGWVKAVVKANPTAAEREQVMYELEPKPAFPGKAAGMAGPLPAGEAAPPGPVSTSSGIEHTIPPEVQKIMEEEWGIGDNTFHPTEEEAFNAAAHRGVWPPEPGANPLTPAGGVPPVGGPLLHDVTVSEPPPVAVSPATKELAASIKALLTRVGLHLVDDRQLLSALRSYFYPHIFQKGPNGETPIQQMESALNPGRRNPWNPDDPHFHRRILEGGLAQLEQAGYPVLKDPAKVVPLYLQAVSKAIANQMSLEYLKGAVIGRDGRRAMFDQTNRPNDVNNPGLYKDFKDLATAEANSGHLWLHPDVHDSIRWQLKPAAITNKAAQRLIQFQQMDRRVGMWNPLFHGLNLQAHAFMQSWVPGRLAFLGAKLSQRPEVLRWAGQWGHLVPSHSVMEDMIDQMQGKIPELRDPLGTFNPKNWLGDPVGTVKAMATIPGRLEDLSQRLLWEGMKRNTQVASMVLMHERATKAGFSHDDASAIAGAYGDRMMGSQDPRTKLWIERMIAPYTFYAYNWTKTHAMQVLESIPGLGTRILSKEHPFLTPDAARFLQRQIMVGSARSLAASIAYTQALNLGLTGITGNPEFTWQNEQGREWNLNITSIYKMLGVPTGGKQVYLASPFMRFVDWYRQYIDDVARANGGQGFPAGLRAGTFSFLPNKLMAPLPGIIQQFDSSNLSTTEGLRSFLTGFPGGILPLTGQLSAADAGGALQSVQQNGPGVLTHPDVSVGRFEGGLAAAALGSNPPYYGPKATVGENLDPIQKRAAGAYLIANKISPATATPQQWDQATQAIQGEVFDQSQSRIKKYQDEEKQAVLDAYKAAGIPDPTATYQKQINDGRSPFDELNALQKQAIFKQHPELELYHQLPSANPDPAVRDVEDETTGYYAALNAKLNEIHQQQLLDDQRFHQGQIDEFTWRDQRSRRMQAVWDPKNGYVAALTQAYPRALTDLNKLNAFRASRGQAQRIPPAVDIAYNQYQSVQLDDPKYQLPDGTPDVLAWNKDRQALLKSLPHDVQTYVHARERANRTPMEQEYQAMVAQYDAFQQQHQKAAETYKQEFKLTNNPRARKIFQLSHPELATYSMARRQWFTMHPLAAFFFQRGSPLTTSLVMGGANPYANPEEQYQQLLNNPLIQQQLGAQGLALSQLQGPVASPSSQGVQQAALGG